MSEIATSASVTAAPDVVSAPAPGEVILLDPVTSAYYSLDAVGERIWELVQEPVSVGAIADTIAAEYEVDPRACLADVKRLVRSLADAGLVHVREPA